MVTVHSHHSWSLLIVTVISHFLQSPFIVNVYSHRLKPRFIEMTVYGHRGKSTFMISNAVKSLNISFYPYENSKIFLFVVVLITNLLILTCCYFIEDLIMLFPVG